MNGEEFFFFGDALHLVFVAEGFVNFFAGSDAHDLDGVFFFARAVLDAHGFGQGLDGGGGRFADEDFAAFGFGHGVEDEADGVIQGHEEARHVRDSEGEGLVVGDLFAEEGDDGAAAAHDVAVADAAEGGLAAEFVLGADDFFHHRFAGAHGVDGFDGLVGAQRDESFDFVGFGGEAGVVGAEDVGFDGFVGMGFAGGDLFEGGGVEDVIDAVHGLIEAVEVADVANDVMVIGMSAGHFPLFLFVAAEDADLFGALGEKFGGHAVAEGTGAACDENGGTR